MIETANQELQDDYDSCDGRAASAGGSPTAVEDGSKEKVGINEEADRDLPLKLFEETKKEKMEKKI